MEGIAVISDLNPDKIKKLTIIIADDSPLIRLGLRTCLEREKDMEVIAETGDGEEAIELAVALHPDIAIVNLGLRILNGIDTTRAIIEKCPGTKVVILSFSDQNIFPDDILRSGASGYLTKIVPLDLIIHTIRRVAVGEKTYPAKIFRQFIQDSPDTAPLLRSKTEEITPREISMLKYIAKGMANKDIAQTLNVTLPVVKTSLTTLFLKLGASSRTEAVAISLKSGILILSDIQQ